MKIFKKISSILFCILAYFPYSYAAFAQEQATPKHQFYNILRMRDKQQQQQAFKQFLLRYSNYISTSDQLARPIANHCTVAHELVAHEQFDLLNFMIETFGENCATSINKRPLNRPRIKGSTAFFALCCHDGPIPPALFEKILHRTPDVARIARADRTTPAQAVAKTHHSENLQLLQIMYTYNPDCFTDPDYLIHTLQENYTPQFNPETCPAFEQAIQFVQNSLTTRSRVVEAPTLTPPQLNPQHRQQYLPTTLPGNLSAAHVQASPPVYAATLMTLQPDLHAPPPQAIRSPQQPHQSPTHHQQNQAASATPSVPSCIRVNGKSYQHDPYGLAEVFKLECLKRTSWSV